MREQLILNNATKILKIYTIIKNNKLIKTEYFKFESYNMSESEWRYEPTIKEVHVDCKEIDFIKKGEKQ